MVYIKGFLKVISNNDKNTLLKLWEEYCCNTEVDMDELFSILENLKNSQLCEAMGKEVEKIFFVLDDLKKDDAFDKIFSLIYDIQTSNSSDLASRAINYLKENYDIINNHHLKLVGLRGTGSFQGAIRNYALLQHIKPNNFVYHESGWGTSEIIEVSELREEIVVECENLAGERRISFKNAFSTLKPLPTTSFLAQRFGYPDDLEKKALSDPVSVVKSLLHDLGAKSALEIKDEMIELVIPEDMWVKWWQTARSKLKKDSSVHVPKNYKDDFYLIEDALSRSDVIKRSIEEAPSISDKINVVYGILRDFSEESKKADCKEFMVASLNDMLEKSSKAGEKIQILFLLNNMQQKVNIEKMLFEEGIEDMFDNMTISALKKRLFVAINKYRKDWKDIFLKYLIGVNQNFIRDYLMQTLLVNDCYEELEKKISAIMRDPASATDFFIWYFGKILVTNNIPMSSDFERMKYLEAFLCFLSKVQDYDRTLGKKMVAILTKDRYKAVRDIFSKASLDDIKEAILLFTKCRLFSEYDVKTIQSLASVYQPVIESVKEEERIFWATKDGIKNAKERVIHIMDVELKDNARELEDAREQGDLRENAGYKAAMEKKRQLQAEAQILSKQLKEARVLTPNDIDTSKVGVGTVVKVKNCSSTKKFTLLGSFDSNPDKGILSMDSAIGKVMFGMKKGDNFFFQGKNFTITNISSYYG